MKTLGNVSPTAEQLPILADDRAGFRLIRGAAGSGKTTVALLRLRQLCASRVRQLERDGLSGPVRALVLTFNRTLRAYIEQLASEQGVASQHLALTVNTFGSWARSVVGSRQMLPDNDRRALVQKLLVQKMGRRTNLPYFIDEVEYVLGRFTPQRRPDYVGVERTGRGRSPPVGRPTRAKLLSDVVAPYERYKEERGLVDWNDLALLAASAESEKYDVVIVDETQDLSANQLRAVISHLHENHVTTFVIDAVQRIYPQGFAWREIGVEMRRNMVFNLRENHRNTAQIARLAQSLVDGLPPEEDGITPDATTCSRQGPKPVMVAGTYSSQLHYMLTHVQTALKAGDTVGVLQPKGGGWFSFARQTLGERGIPYCELTRQADWPVGPEQVALSTIHSAEGLEFDHVMLPGLNQEVTPHGDNMDDAELEALRRLLAMGVGRARRTVTLGYKPEDRSKVIDLIDPNTYTLVEN